MRADYSRCALFYAPCAARHVFYAMPIFTRLFFLMPMPRRLPVLITFVDYFFFRCCLLSLMIRLRLPRYFDCLRLFSIAFADDIFRLYVAIALFCCLMLMMPLMLICRAIDDKMSRYAYAAFVYDARARYLRR